MAREIRTRQVCRDIKALDKAAAAAGHMKHAYVRTKDRAGTAAGTRNASGICGK